MLEYDGIDISEGIDTNKTNKSKKIMLCHFWYFLDKNFSYEPYLCNGCHNIMQKPIDFKSIAIVHLTESAYRIYFLYMNKRKAKNLMNNSNLIDKKGVLYYFLLYIKMSDSTNLTYYQRNRDVVLNKAKDYYKNNKERLREQAKK